MKVCMLYSLEDPTGLPDLPKDAGADVVGRLGLVPGFERKLAALAPDAVILDVRAAPNRTAELVALVRASVPAARILVVGQRDAADSAKAALIGGVAGYLTRDPSPSALASGLRAISRGEVFVTRTGRQAMSKLISELKPEK